MTSAQNTASRDSDRSGKVASHEPITYPIAPKARVVVAFLRAREEISMPTTFLPVSASRRLARPLPHPRSSTVLAWGAKPQEVLNALLR